MKARDTYPSPHCGWPHHLSNGKPYKHECRVVPPEALRAHRDGDHEKASAILAATPDKLVTPRQGVPTDNLPAVETCKQRGYRPGTVLTSEHWKKGPRRVIEVREKDVVLQGKGYKDRVRSLPKDVCVKVNP